MAKIAISGISSIKLGILSPSTVMPFNSSLQKATD